ncbi:MAG: hypothetical protein IKT14_07165, partial [Clostridiales bacterium]|nr:hypothetical protein [Clostridiales bacterium]
MKKKMDLKHLICLSVSAATVLSVSCLTFADSDLPDEQTAVVEESDEIGQDETSDQAGEPEDPASEGDIFTEEDQEYIEDEIFDEPEIVFEDASEVSASGSWEVDENGKRYKEGDTYVKNDWRDIGGKTYYFNYQGYATTGFYTEDNQFYIFDEEGVMQTGWCQLDGRWYYLNPTTGAAYRGWQTIGGKKYYFNDYAYQPYMYADMVSQINGEYYMFGSNGAMLTGFQKTNVYDEFSSVCYFDPETGIRVSGWKKIDGKYYYFGGYNDAMYKNSIQSIDDKYYCFGEDGALKTGWQSETDSYNGTLKWYYFTTKGAYTGWHNISGKWYYFQENTGSYSSKPYMRTGSCTIDEKRYLFDENGVMQTGWVDASPSDDYHMWYYYDPETGAAPTGWKSIGGKWYYFSDYGSVRTGIIFIDGSYYSFDSNGAMQKNKWINLKEYYGYYEDTWLYFGSNGKAVTGWNQIGGKWYYFDPIQETEYGGYTQPTMVTGLQYIGKSYFFFNSSGVMQTGWQCETSGTHKTWFYFGSDGKAVTGWQQLGGKWYHFGEIQTIKYDDWSYTTQPSMDTGVVSIKGKYYFFDENGVMQTGWNKYGGRYVYANNNGEAYVNSWLQSGGKWYYF